MIEFISVIFSLALGSWVMLGVFFVFYYVTFIIYEYLLKPIWISWYYRLEFVEFKKEIRDRKDLNDWWRRLRKNEKKPFGWHRYWSKDEK